MAGAALTGVAFRRVCFVAVLMLLVAGMHLSSCDSTTGPGAGATRTYAMGFTPFPYDMTPQAYTDTWVVIATDGDMAALHHDGGVPWQEALGGSAYPAGFQNELDFSAGAVPQGHVTYVAVTPISGDRRGLAQRRGDEPNQPLEPPWDAYSFDDPEVIEAYGNHCVRMIEALEPDYFAYGIEVNTLNLLNDDEWDAFVALASETYADLKSAYPGLPVFLTLQAETFYASPSSQISAIDDILPYTDMIAVSTYPYTDPLLNPPGDPGAIRGDYFSALADLAPDKPFAIAETAWPAEPLEDPYWPAVPATEETQLQYLERLLEDCDMLDAHFICWFFTRDYDELWEDYYEGTPDEALLRTWRDTGLYAGDGTPRQALGLWLDVLQLSRVAP